MPYVTIRMTDEEKKSLKDLLVNEPITHKGMVEFIEGLMHKAFCEGTMHN